MNSLFSLPFSLCGRRKGKDEEHSNKGDLSVPPLVRQRGRQQHCGEEGSIDLSLSYDSKRFVDI